jgi:hypothetical protein
MAATLLESTRWSPPGPPIALLRLGHLLEARESRLGAHLALVLFLAGGADSGRESWDGNLAVTILKLFPLVLSGLLETRSLDIHNPVLNTMLLPAQKLCRTANNLGSNLQRRGGIS